jgi:hypothetical protein
MAYELHYSSRDALINELKRVINGLMGATIDLRRAHDYAVLGFETAIKLMGDVDVQNSYMKYCQVGGKLLARNVKENTGVDFTFTCDLKTDLDNIMQVYYSLIFRKPRTARYFAMVMLGIILNAAYATQRERRKEQEERQNPEEGI